MLYDIGDKVIDYLNRIKTIAYINPAYKIYLDENKKYIGSDVNIRGGVNENSYLNTYFNSNN